MKNSISRLSTCLVVFGSLVTVSSCRDYEINDDETTMQIAYEHEFERVFGEIDPNQDWDLFGQLARGVGPMTRATADNAEITITDHDGDSNYAIDITQEMHSKYTTVLPESNVENNQYENTNLGRVTQDFVSTSRHFSLAPVHWNTSATDAIGIYWYVDDESAADEAKMGRDGKLYYIKKATIFEAAKCNLYWEDESGTITSAAGIQDVASLWTIAVPARKLITYPKEVSVPSSIAYYGFWIKNGKQATKYSEKNLNEIVTVNGFDEANGKTSSYVATFNIKDQIDENSDDDNNYLCFEDWYTTGDWDLNDVVYWADGLDEGTIVETNTVNEKAILVCEDLAKFDWDFNDIALGLNYKEKTEKTYDLVGGVYQVTGSSEVKKLTVTAMAAGGAYESDVYVNEALWGEIHALLNEANTEEVDDRDHEIINADPTYGEDGQSKEIDFVDYEHWNVGTEAGQYATHLSQLFQTGYFKIVSTDGNAEIIGTPTSSYTYNDDKETNTAPQMMLLPWYFEWPQEQIHIKAAYTGFADWVQDYTQTTWIVDTQVPANITDRGEFVVEEDSGSGSSSSETGQTSETFSLNVTTPASFSYTDDNNNTTTYTNVAYIDLTGYKDLATTDATGELTIVYTWKPTGKIYLDDATGVELITDEFGSNAAVTTTYTLSNSRLRRALQSGGIYIVEKDNSQISVSSATLKISGVTENRHDITLSENTSFTTTGTSTEPIATSTTGAALTFESLDVSVVTVNENGYVTPVGNGTAKIRIIAPASGEYNANIAYATVTVTIGHSITVTSPWQLLDTDETWSKTFTITYSEGSTLNVVKNSTYNSYFDYTLTNTSSTEATVTVTPKMNTYFNNEYTNIDAFTITASGGSYDAAEETVQLYIERSHDLQGVPTSMEFAEIDADAQSFTYTTESGANNVSATSTNTGIATVSVSGTTITVTPVAKGTATIKITAADWGSSFKQTTKEIAVTVNSSIVTLSVGDQNTADGQTYTFTDQNNTEQTINCHSNVITTSSADDYSAINEWTDNSGYAAELVIACGSMNTAPALDLRNAAGESVLSTGYSYSQSSDICTYNSSWPQSLTIKLTRAQLDGFKDADNSNYTITTVYTQYGFYPSSAVLKPYNP